MKILNKSKDVFISENTKEANTFFGRLKGLMFTKNILPYTGLIITPCNSIHMCFMNYSLDVIFVDKDNVVVGLIECIKPWNVSKIYTKASYVIELPIGTIKNTNTQLGDVLEIYKNI